MCGRYTVTDPARLANAFPQFRFPKLTPRYNVAPSTPVLAARNTGEGAAEFLEWGLVPYWADEGHRGAHINARIETVATKPAFRDALRLRRAAIFADGYYEWRQGEGTAKQPYYITLPDRAPFTFAALWDRYTSSLAPPRLTCAIVTADASDDVAWIHDRMPVILEGDARERWLSRDSLDGAEAAAILCATRPALVAVPVSTAVNRAVGDDDASLVNPVTPPEQERLF